MMEEMRLCFTGWHSVRKDAELWLREYKLNLDYKLDALC